MSGGHSCPDHRSALGLLRATFIAPTLIGCGLLFALVGSATVRGQSVTFDLGTLFVDDDPASITLSIPSDSYYNSYRFTTDWSNLGGGAWSREAIWTLADGPLGEPATHYYANPGGASNSAGNTSSITLDWEGFLDLPLIGPRDISFLSVETYPGSQAQWENAILELSYEPPPTFPPLNTNLGTIADEFESFSLTTTGDFDTELAVYSSTSAVIAKNDDAASDPSPTVLSAIDFAFGLPIGHYIAALGSFNTTFADEYTVVPGSGAGNFGLHLGGDFISGALAAGEPVYVGFTIGPAGILPADFDEDGMFTTADVNMLSAEIFAGTNDSAIDLTGDSAVDEADLTKWLADAASYNGFGQAYLRGDANLDGSVNAADLNNLALNWQQVGISSWSGGDFNADGSINALDLNSLALSWQQSIPLASVASAAVPEPSAGLLLVFGLALVCRKSVTTAGSMRGMCWHRDGWM